MVTKVLAVDVGYGFTKWCRRKNNSISQGIIPSIVVPELESDLNGISVDNMKLRLIKTSSGQMRCGSDIHLITYQRGIGKTLSKEYPISDEYETLIKCAILESETKDIEKLVLGLPVALMHLSEKLKTKFTGCIEIGDFRHRVSEVLVLPQPLGSFVQFKYAKPELYKQLNENSSSLLLVDVGFGTTDYITIADEQVLPRRSGGTHIGMGEVLKFMAERIRAIYSGDAIQDLELIDKKLRSGRPLFHNQHTIPYEELLGIANSFNFGPVIKSIEETIATFNDIGCVALTGGGAKYIEPQFKKKYSQLNFQIMPENNFANTLGFLFLTESL